ncbi:hypothetical protein J6590_096758 [Homalodisca vitripennis]|nr:hypothetical protein J6590_096758 [Homalodisca vitripennis]
MNPDAKTRSPSCEREHKNHLRLAGVDEVATFMIDEKCGKDCVTNVHTNRGYSELLKFNQTSLYPVNSQKPVNRDQDRRLKGYFRTTTRSGSLSGHPSKQQPPLTLLDLVILR